MADTLRAFVAVTLPSGVREALAAIQKRLSAERLPIRWVAPGSIHLTLKFLGEIFVSNQEAIREVMEQTARCHAGFHLAAKGLGVFPGFQNPRIVWAGMAGGVKPLADLAQDLEAGLEDLGFPKETRPFAAHLTLGRAKGRVDGRALAAAMAACGGFEAPGFDVTAITLYKSDLQRTGAVYTRIAEAPLGAGETEKEEA